QGSCGQASAIGITCGTRTRSRNSAAFVTHPSTTAQWSPKTLPVSLPKFLWFCTKTDLLCDAFLFMLFFCLFPLINVQSYTLVELLQTLLITQLTLQSLLVRRP